jgi:hypothetical protein
MGIVPTEAVSTVSLGKQQIQWLARIDVSCSVTPGTPWTPQLRAVLFDRPEVIPGARTHLESAGVLDRCQVVGGDFFQRVPHSGDAYLFSRVIHD